ncbi:MAG TPA: 4-hydroxybenzoate octaprenyltransferase [Gammaproteobacteria bacterium]
MRDRLVQYAYLCRLHKPIGIYLLLWPALWALFIAGDGRPDLLVLFVFVAGTVLMRSAGCAINDFADRKIDPHVARTRERPVATGKVSPGEAVGVFIVLALAAFGLVLLMNRLTVHLSFAGVVLAALYPFAKRYTYMPQVVLGAAFGWAVPMAFAAQTGELPVVAWLLFVATLLWATAYDTMYAMVDREDDLRIGVKSTAILFGEADVAIVMFLQALVLVALVLAGQRLQLSVWYYGGVTVAALFVVYQYLLIRHREPARCLKAFLSNHYFGMAVFLGLLLHYISEITKAI